MFHFFLPVLVVGLVCSVLCRSLQCSTKKMQLQNSNYLRDHVGKIRWLAQSTHTHTAKKKRLRNPQASEIDKDISPFWFGPLRTSPNTTLTQTCFLQGHQREDMEEALSGS